MNAHGRNEPGKVSGWIAAVVAAAGCVLPAMPLPAAEDETESRAPLFEQLGRHHHPVTTESELAQRYFDQGLILMYGFNHAEAIRSFEAAAAADPECAMAYWGIALALGPNINRPMPDENVAKAWEALQRARELKDGAGEKERAYIDALAARYQPEPEADRAALDRAYADAMRGLAEAYPDDPDAATLFAEALMDTMPWDYWTEDSEPRPETRELLAALRRVLLETPDHPGANHFHIHAVEAGPTPGVGLPSADRLKTLVPDSGHLVHMPAHIYVRVGQYHDASEANVRAIAADESYIGQCRAQGFYPGAYYPHNIHFLWYTTSLEGRSRQCIEAARKVSDFALDLRCGAVEGPRLRHLTLLAHARFGRWDDLLNEPEPAVEYAFDRAMWHYARGLALAAKGEGTRAAAEQAAFEELAGSDAIRELDSPQFPALGILAVAREVLAGKLAGAGGDLESMIEHLENGVTAEAALPYMEPPYWYHPVLQSLGAALLKHGKAAEAENAFRRDLDQLPSNGWGLFGLEQSLRGQGKAEAADGVRRDFERAWRHADVIPELGWY